MRKVVSYLAKRHALLVKAAQIPLAHKSPGYQDNPLHFDILVKRQKWFGKHAMKKITFLFCLLPVIVVDFLDVFVVSPIVEVYVVLVKYVVVIVGRSRCCARGRGHLRKHLFRPHSGLCCSSCGLRFRGRFFGVGDIFNCLFSGRDGN